MKSFPDEQKLRILFCQANLRETRRKILRKQVTSNIHLHPNSIGKGNSVVILQDNIIAISPPSSLKLFKKQLPKTMYM